MSQFLISFTIFTIIFLNRSLNIKFIQLEDKENA